MEKYIILGIILLVILIPKIIWEIHIHQRYLKNRKDFVSDPFVCPNCGHRFHSKKITTRPFAGNRAYLKCPNCGKRSICARPYDLDSDKN